MRTKIMAGIRKFFQQSTGNNVLTEVPASVTQFLHFVSYQPRDRREDVIRYSPDKTVNALNIVKFAGLN